SPPVIRGGLRRRGHGLHIGCPLPESLSFEKAERSGNSRRPYPAGWRGDNGGRTSVGAGWSISSWKGVGTCRNRKGPTRSQPAARTRDRPRTTKAITTTHNARRPPTTQITSRRLLESWLAIGDAGACSEAAVLAFWERVSFSWGTYAPCPSVLSA